MQTRTITFKHEDNDLGVPIGPVVIIDVIAREADPNTKGFGIPFGYKPEWLDERGWMSLGAARKLAQDEGLTLEES